MVEKLILSHEDFVEKMSTLTSQVKKNYRPTVILALANGGLIPAAHVYKLLNDANTVIKSVKLSFYDGETKRSTPIIDHDTFKNLGLSATDRILIVDDLIDSGSTISYMKQFLQPFQCECRVAVVYTKPHATVTADYVVETTDKWVVFPWE